MKFIHSADWQIGKPFGTIENEESRIMLKHQRIKTLSAISDAVKDYNAEFVVVAGDMFDSDTVSRQDVSRLCKAVGAMKVPVFVIPGNHDRAAPGSIYEQEFFLREKRTHASNMQIILEPKPIKAPNATLLPCPVRYEGSSSTLSWLLNLDFNNIDTTLPRILIAHGSIYDFQQETLSDYINLDILPLNEIDYVALGDWHGTKKINDKTWYSGTHEQDRFPPTEDYDAGNILLVEASRNSIPSVKKIQTGKIAWHSVAKNISSSEELHLLIEQVNNLILESDSEALLQLNLTGTLSLSDLQRLEEVIETWRARFLYLRLKEMPQFIPNEEEIRTKLLSGEDHLISRVTTRLLDEINSSSDKAEIAYAALRQLFSACSKDGGL